MNMELFSSKQEGIDFLNYKAKKRIEELEKICSQNQEQIIININNCEEIFERYNEENLISNIIELDNTVSNEEITPEELMEINLRREELLNKLKSFLDDLLNKYNSENLDLAKKMKYLVDKEDIEFNYKKIVNRSMELQNKKDLVDKIENEYHEAREFDIETFKKNSSTFNMIREHLSLTNELLIEKEPKVEYNEELYVVKIEQAPEHLIAEKNEINEEKFEEEVETQSDNTFFGIDDNLTKQIINNDITEFDEVEEEEPTTLEDVITEQINTKLEEENHDDENEFAEETQSVEQINEEQFTEEENNVEEKTEKTLETTIERASEETVEPNQEESVAVENETKLPEKEEAESVVANEENTTVEEEKSPNEDQNNLTYTMDENDTINNLAFALFQDENITDVAAKMIYEENKEEIDKMLSEKNLEINDNIYKENGILKGLTLNLTNIYEKVMNSQNNK